jgi:hypothetical protein
MTDQEIYGWDVTVEFCDAMIYIPGLESNRVETFRSRGSRKPSRTRFMLKPHARAIINMKPLSKADFIRAYGLNQRM